MAALSTGWNQYLRKQETTRKQEASKRGGNNNTTGTRALFECSCGTWIRDDLDEFKKHVLENPTSHPDLATDPALEEEFKKISTKQHENINLQNESARQTRKRPGPGVLDNPSESADAEQYEQGKGTTQSEARGSKKQRSPERQQSGSPGHGRSRARLVHAGRSLWNPEDGTRPKANAAGSPSTRHTQSNNRINRPSHQHARVLANHGPAAGQQCSPDSGAQQNDDEYNGTSSMIRQPETRPISQDQLVAEVKGIYAGLVMVETKCIEVDNAQSSNKDANHKLNNEQWQALIALHRTLLHEHHDFFLASQHPSASPALRRLASKYAMPARMWRHGIHSFLELLRHRLPASLEHMLTFLYLAYSMMALLYETVPAFEDTWIECLGDLGRYRMAIEDDDIRDREVWTGVSRHWYSKSSYKAPTTGRLYHHLAILARPNALQQLYYYAKSLCVPVPFTSARESVMTLFDPILTSNTSKVSSIDVAFVRVHGILFSGKHRDNLEEYKGNFLDQLDSHIGRATKRWLESGYFIGISLGCALLGYGDATNVLMKAINQRPDDNDVPMEGSMISEPIPGEMFEHTLQFAVRTYEIVICRWGDPNTLPCVHTTLVFLNHMTRYPAAMSYLEDAYPWKLTAMMLNHLLLSCEFVPKVEGTEFPRPEKDETPRPLPEDYAMRGLIYAEDYFPNDWFSNEHVDEDEKYFELASMLNERKERILWLGHIIASMGKWLTWDSSKREFSVTKKYDVELENIPNLSANETLDQAPDIDDVSFEKETPQQILPDVDEVDTQVIASATSSP